MPPDECFLSTTQQHCHIVKPSIRLPIESAITFYFVPRIIVDQKTDIFACDFSLNPLSQNVAHENNNMYQKGKYFSGYQTKLKTDQSINLWLLRLAEMLPSRPFLPMGDSVVL
jgi:hypothetical protein